MRYTHSADPEPMPDAPLCAPDTQLRQLPFNGYVPQLAKYDDIPLPDRRMRAALWRWRRRRLHMIARKLLSALLKGRRRGMT